MKRHAHGMQPAGFLRRRCGGFAVGQGDVGLCCCGGVNGGGGRCSRCGGGQGGPASDVATGSAPPPAGEYTPGARGGDSERAWRRAGRAAQPLRRPGPGARSRRAASPVPASSARAVWVRRFWRCLAASGEPPLSGLRQLQRQRACPASGRRYGTARRRGDGMAHARARLGPLGACMRGRAVAATRVARPDASACTPRARRKLAA